MTRMGDAGGTGRPGPGPVRLGVGSVVARLLAFAAVTGAITAGTLARSDDAWPFAPMSQFAFAVDARDGEIHSRFLEATTDDGGRIRVDLARGGLGIQRGELEGQLWSLTRDPARLQGIAVAHARRFPGQPRFVEVHVMDDVTLLRDGLPIERSTRTLVTWPVIDPADPVDLP